MTMARRTQSPVLHASFDLGGEPSLRDVSEHASSLLAVWRFAASNELASNPREYAHTREGLSRGPVVRRMGLGSPWEIILTTAAKHSAFAAYAAAGIFALERVLRLIMEWQRHRADLRGMKAPPTESEIGEVSARLTSIGINTRGLGDDVKRLMLFPVLYVELVAEDGAERRREDADEDGV